MKIIFIIFMFLLPNVISPLTLRLEPYSCVNIVILKNREVYKLLPYLIGYDSVKRLELIAEAVIESGWGKSTLSRKYNNYYGIKGKDVTMQTFEYQGDVRYECKQSFRKFNSIGDCVEFKVKRVKKMGTCPNKIYDKLKKQVMVIVSNEIKVDTVYGSKIKEIR